MPGSALDVKDEDLRVFTANNGKDSLRQNLTVESNGDINIHNNDLKNVNNIQGVQSINNLEQFMENNQIDVAALTVPGAAAQKITDHLVAAGIKAIWDFTEVPLKVPDDVLLEEQLINEGLCKLSVRMNQLRIDTSESTEDLSCEQK